MSMESDTVFRGVKRPKPDPSPYDALSPSSDDDSAGGVPIVPVRITKRNRRNLIRFSKLALKSYNTNHEGSGVESFKFHDLVKCTFWYDHRYCNYYCKDGDSHLPRPTVFYITFKAKAKAKAQAKANAKAKGDPSSSPDIIIFQAKISIGRGEDDLPVVKECRIKI